MAVALITRAGIVIVGWYANDESDTVALFTRAWIEIS